MAQVRCEAVYRDCWVSSGVWKQCSQRAFYSRGGHPTCGRHMHVERIRWYDDAVRPLRNSQAWNCPVVDTEMPELEKDRERLEKLVVASREMLRAGRSYMNYHAEKFYGDSLPAPTGISPALNKFSEAIDSATRDGEG